MEITGGLIRVGPNDFEDGTPDFDFIVDVVGDHETAILKGLHVDSLSLECAAAIASELRRHGFTHAAWWRLVNGERKLRRFSIERR